jgi:hypothetical protein
MDDCTLCCTCSVVLSQSEHLEMAMMFGRAVLAMLLLMTSSAAYAVDGIFVIPNDNADKLGLNSEDVRTQVGTAIGNELHVGDQLPFLSAMATAADLSSAGMGVDYTATQERFIFGFSLGGASVVSDGEVATMTTDVSVSGDVLPDDGQAVHATLMVGANLGGFLPETNYASRLTVFFNVLQADVPTPDSSYSANATTLGLHTQLKLVRPRSVGWSAWGGLDFTTGIRVGQYRMKMAEELPVEVDAGLVMITWRSVGKYDVTANNVTIPFELSTSARLGPIGLFGGTAFDLSLLSNATSEASLSGNIVAQYVGETQEVPLGKATVALSNQASGRSMTGRLFGGVTLEMDPATIVTQVNYGIGAGFGAHIGMRVSY